MIFGSFEGVLEAILVWIMVYSIVSKVCETVKSCNFAKYCGGETIKKGFEKIKEEKKAENNGD